MGQFQFKISNLSKANINNIIITNVVTTDWMNNLRPDLKLGGKSVNTGGWIQEELGIVKKEGSVNFDLQLIFSDGTDDKLTFDQLCVRPFTTKIRHNDLHHEIQITKQNAFVIMTVNDLTTSPSQPRSVVSSPELEEAVKLANSGLFKESLSKIDMAFSLTPNKETQNKLNVLKLDNLKKFAYQMMNEAWDIERANTPDFIKSTKLFIDAKKLILNALTMKKDDDSLKNLLNCVNLKIEGNKLINSGKSLEKSGINYMQASRWDTAKERFENAKDEFLSAEMKYRQGVTCDSRFDNSVSLVITEIYNSDSKIASIDNMMSAYTKQEEE